MARPEGSFMVADRRIERGEELIAGDHGRFRQRVEQRRFAGIGVADQGHHRQGHAPARLALQAAGALHILELLLELGDALLDEPPVDLELALAGAAEEAEAAALALEMGPGPHQAAALIAEGGELDLQLAFGGAGAGAEDLEDQPACGR